MDDTAFGQRASGYQRTVRLTGLVNVEGPRTPGHPMLNTLNPEFATLALVITLAACAEETPNESTSSADRAALAEFGVAEVEGFGDPSF
jgi:hypothetical protein